MECTNIHGEDYKSAGDAAGNHIWQYIDSLHVNRVCVLCAGDELLPSTSHSHLPLQASIMWLCHKDPECLHILVYTVSA
jgi:hypothetical protein